jgi:hypothetical protein
MYGDGKMEDKQCLRGRGHAIKFTVPRGDWAIKGVRFYAVRKGAGTGAGKRIKLAICDEAVQPVYETSRPQGMVDAITEKWRFIEVEPPLFHPGDIWVIIDTDSTQTDNIFVGIDTTITESHSKIGHPGGPLLDLESLFDWMIRVELTKLGEEETD